jgi:hypothetical protein
MIDYMVLRQKMASSYRTRRQRLREIERHETADYMCARMAYKWLNAQGYVYIARMDDAPFYKIGISKTPEHRAFHMQALPYSMQSIPDITLLHVIETNWTYMLERELHIRFTNQRVGGEWFVLSAVDLLVLRQMKTIDYDLMATLRDRLLEQGWLRIVDAA